METSSLFVATTAVAADCIILPTMRLWPPFFVVDLWLKGTLQPDVRPPYHHHHRGDFLGKVSRLSLSLSPRLTTPKSCLFSSAPLCSRFPFFGDWKEFFSPSCWQIFLKLRTSSLQLRDFESTRYTFFENAVTKLRNVYFYHTSIFLENSFFHFHQRNHHLKSTKVWVVTYINMRNIYIWLESFSFSIWVKVFFSSKVHAFHIKAARESVYTYTHTQIMMGVVGIQNP